MTSEVVIPQTVKVAPFARRDPNEERIKRDEEELAKLEQADPAPGEDVEPEGAEEKTFKKRYGDLRRHSQKVEAELKDRLAKLERQLEESTRKEIKLPKTEEELAEWAERYPDVAKIVETIAIKKAQEQSTSLESRLKEIEEMREQAAQEKAEAKLLSYHPDFAEIRETEEFHDWADKQPRWVKEALYENSTDAESAARAIDLFKADMGMGNKRKKDDSKENARMVTKGGKSAPASSLGSDVIYESAVQKMSAAEYERMEEKIAEAIQKGKFVYDVTGNAR